MNEVRGRQFNENVIRRNYNTGDLEKNLLLVYPETSFCSRTVALSHAADQKIMDILCY